MILLIVFLFYFISGFLTLQDYNINWDEPAHFARGQAYLHFFLTGNKNYRDLPNFNEFWENIGNREQSVNLPRYSIYQNNRDMEHFLDKDAGHPPLNGIIAAFFNYIFYQKLGVVSDVESYHLFIIFVSSLLVAVIFQFVRKEYGNFPAIISFLALSTYPLFISESHNNIKDPIEAAFFTFTLLSFYKAITLRQWRWVILSSIFAGVALSTKFNVFFAPTIIILWILIRYWGVIRRNRLKLLLMVNIRRVALFFICLIIPVAIFFTSWPYLWQDSIGNTLKIFGYYEGIGTGAVNQPSFLIGSFNTYPFLWIVYATPLVVMFLFLLGVIFFILNFKKEKKKVALLAFIWLFITVGRVTFGGFSIYGGGRQIMEYIPAMAMLSGIGAYFIVMTLKNAEQALSKRFKIAKIFFTRHAELTRITTYMVILLSFIPITLKLISIHPNEVVYFNPLIGGLKGAKERDFPSWGLSLGNAYRQAVNWINNNAERKARVALVTSTGPNIPFIFFRQDIRYNNGFWSGNDKNGEYLIEETFDNWARVYYYPVEYVDRILEPVYEVKVDGVPIAKVWKNDMEHTRLEFRNIEWVKTDDIVWSHKDSIIEVELPQVIKLVQVEIYYTTNDCIPISKGKVFISKDGKIWNELLQEVIERYVSYDKLSYPVAGWSAQKINLETVLTGSCPLNVTNVKVGGII